MFLIALRINGKEYTTMFILVTETHNKKSPPKALFESSESRLANWLGTAEQSQEQSFSSLSLGHLLDTQYDWGPKLGQTSK